MLHWAVKTPVFPLVLLKVYDPALDTGIVAWQEAAPTVHGRVPPGQGTAAGGADPQVPPRSDQVPLPLQRRWYEPGVPLSLL